MVIICLEMFGFCCAIKAINFGAFNDRKSQLLQGFFNTPAGHHPPLLNRLEARAINIILPLFTIVFMSLVKC